MMQRYTGLNIFFHWLLAVMIIIAFVVGTIMTDMHFSPLKLKVFSWHKWLGVTILGLVALRLVTRLITGAPSYPDSMSAWQQRLAHWMHGLLYVLMFAVPLSGYFYTLAAGYPVVYFGLIELPILMPANPELKPTLELTHEVLSKVLAIAFFAHLGAALKHLLIDKDGLFQRMLPMRRTS
jgi:cytochrome b561